MLTDGRKEVVDKFNKDLQEHGICVAYGAVFDRPSWGENLKTLIPDYMWEGVAYYIVFGQVPGDFLCAVFQNDLMGAMKRADDINLRAIPDYGRFLYNYAPAGSFGSEKHFRDWVAHGGAVGPEPK